jgi:hypothetical protein
MVNNYLFIIPVVVAIIAVALGVAYQTGALNPIIEKIGVYYFKAEAKAEEKKMEAQGLKEGEDFLKGKWCHCSSHCTENSWMKLVQLSIKQWDDEEATYRFHPLETYADCCIL